MRDHFEERIKSAVKKTESKAARCESKGASSKAHEAKTELKLKFPVESEKGRVDRRKNHESRPKYTQRWRLCATILKKI
jgi:hypothetical protein